MEDDLDSAYGRYTDSKSPEDLTAVVRHLKPVIQYSLGSLNCSDDPFMRSQARVIAGKSVQTYSPEHGANLPTWVSRGLQQLYRIRRQSQSPIKLPDRALLDNMTIARGEREFLDKHNREPDATELADFIKMPISRIQTVRNTMRPVPSASAVGDVSTSGGESDRDSALLEEATHYVHQDADHIDRKIIEMKTGFGGKHTPMEPQAIGVALGLTPSQLSRRSAKLAMLVDQTHTALQATT